MNKYEINKMMAEFIEIPSEKESQDAFSVSWDSLMRVVEKIEEPERLFWFKIETYGGGYRCSINGSKHNFKGESSFIYQRATYSNKMFDAVYEACADFLYHIKNPEVLKL